MLDTFVGMLLLVLVLLLLLLLLQLLLLLLMFRVTAMLDMMGRAWTTVG
jgi:hypothetical protein